MHILIVGLPKSGTTILTYRVAEALDDVFVDFEPAGPPTASVGAGHRNLVTKKLVGSQTESLTDYDHYDRKIWITRDPRDFLVSQSLYRWHREEPPDDIDRLWFDRVFEKLVAKEADPSSTSFLDLEPANYFETLDAVADLRNREIDDRWLLFRYEDMVDGRYEALNRYLGFEVVPEAEVAPGLERVVRSRGYGGWRDWFTPSDVDFYASGGLSRYMAAFGYDADDWVLNDPQRIDPDHSSIYVAALFDDHLGRTPAEGQDPGPAASTPTSGSTPTPTAAPGRIETPARGNRWFSLWSNRA